MTLFEHQISPRNPLANRYRYSEYCLVVCNFIDQINEDFFRFLTLYSEKGMSGVIQVILWGAT